MKNKHIKEIMTNLGHIGLIVHKYNAHKHLPWRSIQDWGTRLEE